MDIDLLSKMVKELILDDDRVVLPGLGCFVAEIVPAYFSDKGYTINPPYRKLYFRARPDEGDALIEFYAKSNKVDYDIAEKVIKDFVAELKSVLHVKKTVVFPGLGRLRATKENNVFFVADEDLDIYPEGFGLEPISLKTHQESREEVAAAVASLKNVLSETAPVPEPVAEPVPVAEPEIIADPVYEPEPVPEPVPEPEPAPVPEPEVATEPVVGPEPAPEPDPAPVPEPAPAVTPEEKKSIGWGRILTMVLIVFAVLVIAYMVVGRLCPDWIDQFLYTPEELEILKR